MSHTVRPFLHKNLYTSGRFNQKLFIFRWALLGFNQKEGPTFLQSPSVYVARQRPSFQLPPPPAETETDSEEELH